MTETQEGLAQSIEYLDAVSKEFLVLAARMGAKLREQGVDPSPFFQEAERNLRKFADARKAQRGQPN